MKCQAKPFNPCPKGVINAKCVVYTGINLTNISVVTNDRLDDILEKIDEAVGDFFFSLFKEDSDTVDFSGDGSSGSPLIADVKVSVDTGNLLEVRSDGLFVRTPLENGLIDGGLVTWITGYTYDVSEANYIINSQEYNSDTTQITLDPADPLNDRIDVIVVDISENVVVLTGVASEDPQAPSVDPETQLILTFVYVTANTVEPIIPQEWIYQEGVEWTPVSSTIRINPTSGSNPDSGSFDVEATLAIDGDNIKFTAPVDPIMSDFRVLTLKIRSKAAWGTSSITFRFYDGASPLGIPITLSSGSYGFNSSIIGSYQVVSLLLDNFGTISTADSLLITVNTSTTLGFYIDNIQLQDAGETIGSDNIYFKHLGNVFGAKAVLGTLDNQDIGVISNNTERMLVTKTGHILYNKTSPTTLPNSSGLGSLTPLLQTNGINMATGLILGAPIVNRISAGDALQVYGNTYLEGPTGPTINWVNQTLTMNGSSSSGRLLLTAQGTGYAMNIQHNRDNSASFVIENVNTGANTRPRVAWGYKHVTSGFSAAWTDIATKQANLFGYNYSNNDTGITQITSSYNSYLEAYPLDKTSNIIRYKGISANPIVSTTTIELLTTTFTALYPSGAGGANGKILIGQSTVDASNVALQVTGGAIFSGLSTDNTAANVYAQDSAGKFVLRTVASIGGGGGSSFSQSIQSGNGVTTTFNIAHGLAGTPKFSIQPASQDAAGYSYATANSTNIVINYGVAPPSGTNNLTFNWTANL
jgi:hypothetical protein